MTDGIDACDLKRNAQNTVAVGHTQHNILSLVPCHLGYMGIKSQKKKKKSNFTSFIQCREEMYWLTNGEMSQEGHKGPFMRWLWLHFSVILFALSPSECWLLPMTGHHICAWQRVKGKEGRIHLKALPEKWMIDLVFHLPPKVCHWEYHWPSMNHVPISEPITCKEED